jgi:fatty-acid desaturase
MHMTLSIKLKILIIGLLYLSVPVLMFTYDNFILLAICSFLLTILINAFAFSTVYHKLFAHRSFKPKAWVPYVGTFIGLLLLLPTPRSFLVQHRLHHRFSDTERDTHSPKFGKLATFMPYFFRGKGIKYHSPDIFYSISKDFERDYPILNRLTEDIALLVYIVFNSVMLFIGVDYFIVSVMVSLGSIILNGYANTFYHKIQENGDVVIVNKPLMARFISPEANHAQHHNFASSYDFSSESAKDWMAPIIDRFLKKQY